MKYIEVFTFMFFDNEFKPVHEGVVHAFVRAEAGDADSARGEGPLFGGEQVHGRRKDADFVSRRGQQTSESFG